MAPILIGSHSAGLAAIVADEPVRKRGNVAALEVNPCLSATARGFRPTAAPAFFPDVVPGMVFGGAPTFDEGREIAGC